LGIKRRIEMKERIDILREVKIELERFTVKLALALKEQSNGDKLMGRHYVATKRAALDLKNELTKLTQDSRYLYNS
jgi:hypothetical protein